MAITRLYSLLLCGGSKINNKKKKKKKKTVLYTCVHKTTHVSGVRTQRRTALIWAFYSLYTHTHKAYLICVSSLSLVCDV
jgi:hypothetical protein